MNINNTIYTSNSAFNTIYANTTAGLNSLLQNRINAAVNKNLTYGEMLQSLKHSVDAEMITEKSTAEMTMDEYKNYIAAEIKKLDFDSSHYADDEIIQISDAGWEAMKNNPNYENWVLNKISANRKTPNQLAGMGFGGAYNILSFGANEQAYHETTWYKNFSQIDDFFSSVFDMSSLLGNKSKSKNKTSAWGNIFSMQAERLKMQSALAAQQAALHQRIQNAMSTISE